MILSVSKLRHFRCILKYQQTRALAAGSRRLMTTNSFLFVFRNRASSLPKKSFCGCRRRLVTNKLWKSVGLFFFYFSQHNLLDSQPVPQHALLFFSEAKSVDENRSLVINATCCGVLIRYRFPPPKKCTYIHTYIYIYNMRICFCQIFMNLYVVKRATSQRGLV